MRITMAFLIAFSIIIAGCGKSKEQIEMEKQNAQLKQELATKDLFVEDVTTAINEIHNKLESTWAMQKNIVQKNPTVEDGKLLSQAELKTKILDRITDISTVITENRKKITSLQRKLADQKTQYVGLSKMVDDLKVTLEEREKTIADLQTKVQSLEGDITAKVKLIAERDVIIEHQTNQINTAYYVVGKQGELKDKKIISYEGGILWGLLGTTPVLTGLYNEADFTQLDRTKDMMIEVAGTIDEIVPARDTSSYTQVEKSNNHTLLKIIKPESFWRVSHLAIVTD